MGSLAYKHSENFVERMARVVLVHPQGLKALPIHDSTDADSHFFKVPARRTNCTRSIHNNQPSELRPLCLLLQRLLADGQEDAPVVRNGKYEKLVGKYLRKLNQLDQLLG